MTLRNWLIAAALVALPLCAPAAELSTLEQAGKRLYTEGIPPSGAQLTARVGNSSFDAPATALPCANCHGPDGRGRPEGGITPPDITWSELTKSYGHVHPNGRRHPPFDEASLYRAIRLGNDPAGNELERSMPRYNLAREDYDALLAYMKKLENQLDPGLSAQAVRIGTLLPLSGRLADFGGAVRGLLEAKFAEINAQGGLYGRKLELVVAEYADDRLHASANLRTLIEERDVFAILAPFAAGMDEEFGRLTEQARVPVIAPLSRPAEDLLHVNQHVFHLLSGIGELAQVLGEHAAKQLKTADMPAALFHVQSLAGEALANAVAERLKQRGFRTIERIGVEPAGSAPAELARRLQASGAASAFVLAGGIDLPALAGAAEQAGWRGHLMIPGPIAPRGVLELPASLDGHVWLAYPTLPSDQKPGALREYAALFQSGKLNRGFQPMQVQAYAGALVLIEALKRAGRELSRDKLVATLEALQEYDSGMLPTLSYNANRRVGALGGYIVAVDLKNKDFRPTGGFVRLQ